MKSIIITGANRGIGLSSALVFGRAGYQVFATMRNPDKANELKQAIEEESLNIKMMQMDVDSDISVSNCMNQIHQMVGAVDVLLNNAGIERHGAVELMDISEFKAVMETNYFGVIRCTKAVLPAMRENRKGCIMNVASVAGHISTSPLTSYSASKYALEAFSEGLAQEVKPFQIKVKIIEPGIINTDMANDIQHGERSEDYPQAYRFGGMFAASLENPTSPDFAAETILAVAESDDWKLRHPVGPDAEPFIAWRKSMNDEEWVDWNAAGDDDWYENVQQTFGLDARAAVNKI